MITIEVRKVYHDRYWEWAIVKQTEGLLGGTHGKQDLAKSGFHHSFDECLAEAKLVKGLTTIKTIIPQPPIEEVIE